MTRYSKKKGYLLQNDMQKTGNEICKPEGRAWKKHMGKNKERNRRDLCT